MSSYTCRVTDCVKASVTYATEKGRNQHESVAHGVVGQSAFRLAADAALARALSRSQLQVHGTKICRQCQSLRPLSEFGRRVNHPDGLETRCRTCMHAPKASDGSTVPCSYCERRFVNVNGRSSHVIQVHPERVMGYMAANGEKRCSRCEETRSLASFRRCSHKRDGYRPTCRRCELGHDQPALVRVTGSRNAGNDRPLPEDAIQNLEAVRRRAVRGHGEGHMDSAGLMDLLSSLPRKRKAA